MNVDNKKILEDLKSDITSSESNKQLNDKKIIERVKEFNGEPYGNERKNKAQVVSRDIKRTALWQHASIIDPFVSSPEIIKCLPVTKSDVEAAKQSEQLLNYQFCRDFERYNFISNSFKVLQREGTVIARVYWEFQEEEIEVEKPIYQNVPITDPVKYQQTIQQGLPPYERVVVDVETVIETKTVINRPRVKLIKNSMAWIDPTAEGSIEDAKFIAYKFKSSMSELMQEGIYKNLDKIKNVVGGPIIDPDTPYYEDQTFSFSDKPRKQVEVTEYWGYYDIDGDGITEPIVCTWVDNVIIRLEKNPYPDEKLPFVSCAYDSEPYSIYGSSIGDTISTEQKIKTGIKRAILDTLDASTNGQKAVRAGSLDVLNKKKFINGEDFEFLGSVQDFWEGKFNTIPTDVLNFYSMIDQDIVNTSGVRPFGPTGADKLDSRNGGLVSSLDNAARREIDISRNFKENFLVPILRKWHSMNVEFLEDEQIIRVTDADFVAIKRDDIQGRIDIDMNVSTTQVNDEKANNISFMLQTMAQTLPFGLVQLLLAEQERLKGMPDIAAKIADYKPEPNPIAQKQQELELAKLQAEINERNSRVGENYVDARLKSAKAINEEAKARKAHSEADAKDLEFLRKADGTERKEKLDDDLLKYGTELKKADQSAALDYIKQAQLMDDNIRLNPSLTDAKEKSKQA